MFESPAAAVTVEVAVKQLADAVDTLLAVDLTGASRGELLELARGLETQRRRLPAADHALIGELESRGVAGELCCPSSGYLLARLLRLAPGEARARVRAAGDLGARRTLTGQLLPPVFPAVAAAQAEGAICDRHAAVIRSTVHALPAAAAEQAEQVEAALTGHAHTLDPDQLGKAARRLLACLDPDGTRPDDADHARRRDLTLHRMADGSARLTGYLTPGCAAVTEAWLDALAAPVPAADGQPDRRSGGQRRHDALEDIGRRALRTGDLPDCGGTPATLLLTMTLADLESRLGVGDHRARRADLRPGGAAAGRRSRHHPGRARRRRRDPGPWPQPPGRLIWTASGPGRPRPRMFLPLVRSATELVPKPSHRAVDRRRAHRPGQPDTRLRVPPPGVRQARLGLPHHRRPPPLDPASLARPRSATPPKQRPRHRPGLTPPYCAPP